jgi:membrane-associated protease RseP (regulator of RpoE activity)
VPHRRALFDIGLTGSMVSFLLSLPILLWGLAQSQPIQRTAESGIFRFESFNPHNSLLLAVLSKLALGSAFTAETALRLHPVAVAGCIGIVITALNLVPVGQLDGGQIVHAMFGQRMGALIGQVARLLVLLLSLVQQELLLWAVLLFLLPAVDAPTLNDVSELDNLRDFWGLVALALLIVILLPPPPVLSQFLGIA